MTKIIHVAFIFPEKQKKETLFLRQTEDYRYIWCIRNVSGDWIETSVWAGTAAEAILAGRKFWKIKNFRVLNCGFRYTLPERDEIGTNALFYQMVSSYQSINGVYFDEDLGSNCIVQNASLEARSLAKNL